MTNTNDVTLPRVVIHVDANGNCTAYADPGVEVISCYDVTPNDRLYRMDPDPIPDGLLDGPVGHANDGSAAMARVSRAVKEAFGLPVFDVVKP